MTKRKIQIDWHFVWQEFDQWNREKMKQVWTVHGPTLSMPNPQEAHEKIQELVERFIK